MDDLKTEFGLLIESNTKRLGMNYRELAKLIGKSPQYINYLKNSTKGKPLNIPTNVLRKLLNILSKNSIEDKNSDIDKSRYLNFLSKYLEIEEIISSIEITKSFSDILKGQRNIMQNSEIWIFADVLAQFRDEKYARYPIQNIINKNFKYKFFVPLDDKYKWKIALERMIVEFEASSLNEKKLGDNLEIYAMSGLFIQQISVINPRSENMQAYVNIGGDKDEEFRYLKMDARRISRKIDKIDDLMASTVNLNTSKKYVTETNTQISIVKHYPFVS